jgi:hypothetical protein
MASKTAQQVFALFPRLQTSPNAIIQTPAGRRVIDFALNFGSKSANFEIKYKLPASAGDALTRLTGQISAMVSQSAAGQQAVVWTMKEPTMTEVQLIQKSIGPTTFGQVQFVHEVEGLFQWIQLYFGL